MRLIGFVTERKPVARSLYHNGEPSEPPKLAPAQAPPLREEALASIVCGSEAVRDAQREEARLANTKE